MNKKYQKCFNYIERSWAGFVFKTKHDIGIHLALPNKFISPNAELFAKDQFYWDSYFIILGLVVSGRQKLARGMVDNLVYLFNRFGFIPARNLFPSIAVSQPPFLTSMILEVFSSLPNKKWLAQVAEAAEGELANYWKDGGYRAKSGCPVHLVKHGLSRYAGYYRSNLVAEYESGWDETSRFGGKCLEFASVDLNSLLYKYEIDLSEIYELLGKKEKAKSFMIAAKQRKTAMTKFFWNEKKGFFFDYNKDKKEQSDFWSLAGFYPLFVKLATKEQAEVMVKNLKKFEFAGGLANTANQKLYKDFKQWDYPNGWPNQQWIVLKGLLNYGYEKEARRLAIKWLDLNLAIFKETGFLWEKYDVVKKTIGQIDMK
ncbi:MAG: trehalase family glycosidase [Patescibacteria group bacterium]|jgi:alpha,alpha-trehalase